MHQFRNLETWIGEINMSRYTQKTRTTSVARGFKQLFVLITLALILIACEGGGGGTNNAPTIAPISDQSNAVNTSVNVTVTAVDADGDALTYSANGLPAGISISSSTGAMTGSATAEGTNNVTVTVSDTKAIASSTFVWTITDDAPPPSGDGAERIKAAGVLTTQALGEVKNKKTSEPVVNKIPGVGNNPTATCTTTGWTQEEVRELTGTVGLNLSGTTIYPGALIRGSNFKNGEFTAITIPRSGGTITMTGLNLGNGSQVSRNVNEIRHSEVQQAIADILSNPILGTAAQASYEEDVLYSYEHLTFQLGIDGRYGKTFNMKSKLNLENTKEKNYVFSKFTQVYYDMTYEDPELSTSVFRDGANFSDPEGQIGPDNPPLYVSKVSYGRMVFFVAESEHESSEVEAALKVAVKGGLGSGTVKSGLTYKEVMERTKVYYHVIGGDAKLALAPIDSANPDEMFDKVKAFMAGTEDNEDGENGRTAAEYSPTSPGVPISYTLNYLSDRTPARMSYSVNFDKKDCTFDYPAPAPTTKRITVDASSDNANYWIKVNHVIVLSKDAGTSAGNFDLTPYLKDNSELLEIGLWNNGGGPYSMSYKIYANGQSVKTRSPSGNDGICGSDCTHWWRFDVNKSTGSVVFKESR